jgi:hypothetical protein
MISTKDKRNYLMICATKLIEAVTDDVFKVEDLEKIIARVIVGVKEDDCEELRQLLFFCATVAVKGGDKLEVKKGLILKRLPDVYRNLLQKKFRRDEKSIQEKVDVLSADINYLAGPQQTRPWTPITPKGYTKSGAAWEVLKDETSAPASNKPGEGKSSKG